MINFTGVFGESVVAKFWHRMVLIIKMLEKWAWQCRGVMRVGVGQTPPLPGSYYGNHQYIALLL